MATTTKESSDSQIELLTEENYPSWYVDVRAKLRSKKLWKYTQSPYKDENAEDTVQGESSTSPTITTTSVSKKEQKAMKDWEDGTQEAADFLTPTISRTVKRKLTEIEFNNGYLMMTRLQILLQPSGSSEFMRLSKEYYSLQFKSFKSMTEYLTHIKVLEEKIDATKVTLNMDNRTILCLSMSLPQEYQYLIQIWAVTEGITAEKARTMLLEASRQHKLALHNEPDPGRHGSLKAQEDKCKHCGSTRHPSDICWATFPHLAPEWYQIKLKYDAQRKEKKGKAMVARGNDFKDHDGHVHISA